MIHPKKIGQGPGDNPQDGIRLEDEWVEGTERAKRKSNPLPDSIDEEYLAP
jgi:hypothetical protein